MQRQDPVSAEALLHALLDRFEAPLEPTRDVIASIDYTKVGGPAAQDVLKMHLIF